VNPYNDFSDTPIRSTGPEANRYKRIVLSDSQMGPCLHFVFTPITWPFCVTSKYQYPKIQFEERIWFQYFYWNEFSIGMELWKMHLATVQKNFNNELIKALFTSTFENSVIHLLTLIVRYQFIDALRWWFSIIDTHLVEVQNDPHYS